MIRIKSQKKQYPKNPRESPLDKKLILLLTLILLNSSATAQCSDGIDNDGDGYIDALSIDANQNTGLWVKTWAGDCQSVCAVQGLSSAANSNGDECVSGENVLNECVNALGLNILVSGCWCGDGHQWGDCDICRIESSDTFSYGAYCYHPGQKKDYDATDITAACYCVGSNPVCSNNIDDDGDGLVDAADRGCWEDITDSTSYNGDITSEVPHDSQCTSASGRESYACSDGIDNDGDSFIDFDRGVSGGAQLSLIVNYTPLNGPWTHQGFDAAILPPVLVLDNLIPGQAIFITDVKGTYRLSTGGTPYSCLNGHPTYMVPQIAFTSGNTIIQQKDLKDFLTAQTVPSGATSLHIFIPESDTYKGWYHDNSGTCSVVVVRTGTALTSTHADPGCTSAADLSESNPPSNCSDGVDNDGDNMIDALVEGTAQGGETTITPSGTVTSTVTPSGDTIVWIWHRPTAIRFDDESATRVCELAGYSRLVSKTKHHAGCKARCFWSPEDNSILRWDSSSNSWYETQAVSDYGNVNAHCIETVVCADKFPDCSDRADNDNDGQFDYPADSGCVSANDTSEEPHDPDCTSPLDPTENSECDDGVDNDGDGKTDFGTTANHDPGCASAQDDSERNPNVQCDDGVDNDGDGRIDYRVVVTNPEGDSDCTSPTDILERTPVPIALIIAPASVDIGSSPTIETAPWQNHALPPDVNGVGGVTSLDILNFLSVFNSEGPHILGPPNGTHFPPYYVDVNGDNRLSEDDYDQVVNHLNTPGSNNKSTYNWDIRFVTPSATTDVTPSPDTNPTLSFTPAHATAHDPGMYYNITLVISYVNSQSAMSSTRMNVVSECSDGIDNEPDGFIDEDDPGCRTVPHDPATYDPDDDNEGDRNPSDEICNNLDDDFDGSIDEGLTQTQSCGTTSIGECEYGSQTKTCSAGVWGEWGLCQGNIEPTTETCNNLDDDCDGSIDEGGVCGGTIYYCDNDSDQFFDASVDGSCSTFNCVPAGCREAPGNDCDDANPGVNPAAAEICDGLDNDCNGLVDDGVVCSLDSPEPVIVLNGDGSVTLSWPAVAGASSYNIYAVDSCSGLGVDFPLIANGLSAPSWIDFTSGAYQERYYKVAAVRGAETVLSVYAVGKFDVSLGEGWNLASVPLLPSNPTIKPFAGSVFKGLHDGGTSDFGQNFDGSYDFVVGPIADGSTVLGSFDPKVPSLIPQNLVNITDKIAFQILMNRADVLTVVGRIPDSTSISVASADWFWVGYPSCSIGDIKPFSSSVLASLHDGVATDFGPSFDGNYDFLVGPFNGFNFLGTFDPLKPPALPQNLEEMGPGRGYIIDLRGADDFIVSFHD